MKWIIILLFLFTAFLFFTSILQMFLNSDKRMNKRMKRYLDISKNKSLDRKKFNFLVEMQLYNQKIREKVLSKKKNQKLEDELSRAGVPLKPEEYIMFQIISTMFSALLFYLIADNYLFLAIGAVLGIIIPRTWIKKKQKERILKFNGGLPDMVTTIVGSLRAGFSFPQALKTVVEESESPIKEEIGIVIKEMQYGSTLEDALEQLKERMPSEDLELLIQSVIIQKKVGGNLATILATIVQTIRDRNKIQRQILTLTAQGRLSGIVMGLLPLILGLALYLIEPDYIGTLFTHPVGMMMVGIGVVMGIIGFIFIRKLTQIEV